MLGFRSGKRWHRICAIVFFAALYAVFVLTMFPPVPAGNRDVVVYKVIRLVLFAIPVLTVLFLSDFAWCKRIPLFSSERRSQRLVGVATLTALLVCLSVNMTYLHTSEYREALQERAVSLVIGPSEKTDAAHTNDATPATDVSASEPATETAADDANSLSSAWNDQREGCGTD